MTGWALFRSRLMIAHNCIRGERGKTARRDNAPLNKTAMLLIPGLLRDRDGLEPSAGNARSSDILFRKNDGKSSIR